MTVTLYDCATAPSPRRARILLAEKGVAHGTVQTDNAAIAAYLEARYPEPPLQGITPLEKAEVAHWHWRAEFEGLLAIAEALRNSSPAMANRALPGPVNYPQIPALAERGIARLQQFLADLNQ